MDRDWLTRQLTLEEVETLHAVQDERLGPTPVAFGFINDKWKRLTAHMQPGDELWEFRSPPESWQHLCGLAGIVLIRDGTMIDWIVTSRN